MDSLPARTPTSRLTPDDRMSVMRAFKALCAQTPYGVVDKFIITPQVNVLPSGKIAIGLEAENVPQAGATAWLGSLMKQIMPNLDDMQLGIQAGAIVATTTFTFSNPEKLQEAVNAAYVKLGGKGELLKFNTAEQSAAR